MANPPSPLKPLIPNVPAIVEMAGGVRQVANPIALSDTPVVYRRVPPPLGADDAAVRAWLREGDGSPLPA